MKPPLQHLGTHHDITLNSVYLVMFEKLQQAAFPPPQKIGNLFSKSVFFFAAVEKKGGVWSRQPRDTSLSSWSFSEISKGLLLLSWTVLWQGFWMRGLVKFTYFASFWPSETIEAMYCWWVERCLVSKPLFARFHVSQCVVGFLPSPVFPLETEYNKGLVFELSPLPWLIFGKQTRSWSRLDGDIIKSPAIRLAKTNMAPENRPSSKESSFPTTIFQWRTVSFRGGTRFGSILFKFCWIHSRGCIPKWRFWKHIYHPGSFCWKIGFCSPFFLCQWYCWWFRNPVFTSWGW